MTFSQATFEIEDKTSFLLEKIVSVEICLHLQGIKDKVAKSFNLIFAWFFFLVGREEHGERVSNKTK